MELSVFPEIDDKIYEKYLRIWQMGSVALALLFVEREKGAAGSKAILRPVTTFSFPFISTVATRAWLFLLQNLLSVRTFHSHFHFRALTLRGGYFWYLIQCPTK